MRHVSNAIMEVSRSRENAHAVLLVERFDGGRFAERPDFVVQEVSIEVFLDGRPTFRGTCSPWDVEDLVVGRLFLEGAIVEMDDVVSIEVDLEGGRVDVLTRPRGRRTGDGCVIVPFGSLPGRAPAGVPVAARPLSDMQVAAATVNAAIAVGAPVALVQENGRCAQCCFGRHAWSRAGLARGYRPTQRLG